MTKVILIAILSMLAAAQSVGVPFMPATALDHEWTTPSPGSFVISARPAAPLVCMNHLAAVEFPVRPTHWAYGHEQRTPQLQTVLQTASDSPVSERRWDRVVELSPTGMNVQQARRARWRSARERSFRPQPQVLRGTQVGLSRKQP